MDEGRVKYVPESQAAALCLATLATAVQWIVRANLIVALSRNGRTGSTYTPTTVGVAARTFFRRVRAESPGCSSPVLSSRLEEARIAYK